MTMTKQAIASAIERDLLRCDAPTGPDTTKCFSCGRGMIDKGSRFCGERCRDDWYDAGRPGLEQDWLLPAQRFHGRDGHAMLPTKNGFVIQCVRCHKEFESRGLRCCSPECERAYREREENLRLMAEVGLELPVKRTCADCGAIIPKWRNGRRVSRTTRFCSPGCSRRAKLAA